MTSQEFLGDRRRAQEEEYFQKREQELIAKLQQRAHAAAARGELAARTGVADQEILDDLAALGYTPETLMLLHLVPLIQTAWADGGVAEREQELIVEAARARGVEAGSPADQQLGEWITTRPSADFFDRTLRAVRAILQAQPADARATDEHDLLAYSAAIAGASGGILGFGKVSADEERVLAQISAALNART
jgi:hypothetical protein